MLVLLNAFKSIARSKGRNILIGIIVLAIAASSCVALAIRSAANEAQSAGLDLVNVTGSIAVDRQKLMSQAQDSQTTSNGRPDMSAMRELLEQYQELPLSELLAYAQSDHVKDFRYSGMLSLDASGELEPYSTSDTDDTDDTDGAEDNIVSGGPAVFESRGGGGRMFTINGGMAMGDFNITGYSAEEAMTAFINGTSQITDGQMFDTSLSDRECLISAELAAFNGLAVGDEITLANPRAEEEVYTFTIAGIYTNSSASDGSNEMRFSTSQDPANLICVSYGSLLAIQEASANAATVTTDDNGMETSTELNSQLSGTFVFANKESYENFETELRAKGLSEYYTLSSTDINAYEASLTPLKNLSSFASMLLWIVLAIGGIILVGINIINIRERKYEVGVLTAIGIKKGKVAMQFVTELLCVTLLAIFVGTGIGAVVSVPVSNNLLSAQITQMQAQSQTQNQSFGRPGGNGGPQGGGLVIQGNAGGNMMSVFNQEDVDYLDKVNATINVSVVGQLMGIGVFLTLVSSLAAVVFVLRYEPLKILANRA